MLSKLKFFLKGKIKQAKVILFRGDKYICPFCGFQSSKLGKFGFNHPVIKEKKIIGSGLRRSRCYKCNSSDRERLIYSYLEKEIEFFHNKNDASILHISPEPNLSNYIKENIFKEYIGGDLYTEGYFYPDFVKNMDITSIPYGDKYFDLILCNHVLEHIIDDKKAIQELYRVLKPGGIAILQVPISLVLEKSYENFTITSALEREKYFGQYDHVRIYGQDYKEKLEMKGFIVSTYDLAKKYKKFGLNAQEILYIGNKI